MKTKQKLVYIFPCGDSFDFRSHEQVADYKTMTKYARENDNVMSLYDFQEAINDEILNLSNYFILIF